MHKPLRVRAKDLVQFGFEGRDRGFVAHLDGVSEEELETLNKRILEELNNISWGMISDTTIKGTHMLQACNTNHRSTRKDFDYLVTKVKKLGEQQRIHFSG